MHGHSSYATIQQPYWDTVFYYISVCYPDQPCTRIIEISVFICDKYSVDWLPVSRLTDVREPGSVSHYPVRIWAALDFHTLQNHSLFSIHLLEHVFLLDSLSPLSPCLPVSKNPLTLCTMEFYYLSYTFIDIKLKQMCFFPMHFLYMSECFIYNVYVYYCKTCFPFLKWMVSNLVDLLQSRCNGY